MKELIVLEWAVLALGCTSALLGFWYFVVVCLR